MRYLVGFVLVLFPLGVGAQDVEEAATAEPGVQEPAPSFEPPSEQPALQLQLDDAGVEVAPSPPRTPDGYTLEEMDVRVRRAKIGLGVSGGVFLAGVVMGSIYLAKAEPLNICFDCPPPPPESVDRVGWAGVALTSAGFVGMITSGILLRKRKRDRDSLRGPHYKTPRSLEPTSPDDLTGAKLRQRQRELRNLREAHYGTPRRVQWDLAQSRVVF